MVRKIKSPRASAGKLLRRARPVIAGDARIDRRSYKGTVEDFLGKGEWVKVKSSNVVSIMYEKAAMRLHVRFKSGSGYYSSVPPSVAKDMFNASSMGKFVHYRLKNKFDWVRGGASPLNS